MGNANVGNNNGFGKQGQILQIIPDLPFEIQNHIWTKIIFENMNLTEILKIIGKYDKLDYIIYFHFSCNYFIISRYMNKLTYLKISNVLDKILLTSSEFEKLLGLCLNKKIVIQNLVFQREVDEVIHLNKKIETLVYYATNLCFVFYQQLLELQNWNIIFLSKIEYLSISASDDLRKLQTGELKKLTHVVLNIYEYPLNIKYISKIVSFLLKLKLLKYLDINFIIEKEFELPRCLIETLKKLSGKHVYISIKILNNNLTYQNMTFAWLANKLESICQYITNMDVTLASNTSYLDFYILNSYVKLENLKISVNYSSSKLGEFKIRSKILKNLEFSYFDKQLKYSLKNLPNLKELKLFACDITTKIINHLPKKLIKLKLLECYFDPTALFKLPEDLKIFEYKESLKVRDFPKIENITELYNLEHLNLLLLHTLSQEFIDKLPNNLKNVNISCQDFKNHINWNSMNFSNLKKISNFQIVGTCIEYDLHLLPRNLTYLNFNLDVSVLKNKLPFKLRKLDITIHDNFNNFNSICYTLNNIKESCTGLEHLIIRSNRLELDFTKLIYDNLKTIKIYIGHGIFSSEANIRIGHIPNSLVEFNIISKANKTVLIAPKLGVLPNNLNKIGILNGINELKEYNVPKINLEIPMNRLKIENVSNKMKNQNQKTKLKFKNLFKG
jgi:hypothetical protein